ncbi:UNVERIFIED_CONTAM: hypothetical protein Slati_1785000 [Sesamum latifolium]|uniref:RING-CH-type domain-containing protein n=1 Tax=Sesamum latifolium TaxID=2727402 RepID=A0AAW2WZ00_9LAMI
MQNGGAAATMAAETDTDIEKQRSDGGEDGGGLRENIVGGQSQDLVEKVIDVVVVVDCPDKGEPQLARNSTSHEECRVCQEETEEVLINLGCQCRGGLQKHTSHAWFNTRGSNKCEICQQIAANVSPPDSQASAVMLNECISKNGAVFYSVSVSSIKSSRNPGIALLHYLLEQLFHVVSVPSVVAEIAIQVTGFGGLIQPLELNSVKGPLWVAFSILIGGLLLDVLISVTLGVSALPVNIIIGVIVVLGLGTALRLALEFCQEWNVSSAKGGSKCQSRLSSCFVGETCIYNVLVDACFDVNGSYDVLYHSRVGRGILSVSCLGPVVFVVNEAFIVYIRPHLL